MTNKNQQQQSW